jgi:hypothetical protein
VAEEVLHQLLPVVRRARGYRLYGHDGRRYLDLWQGGGRSLLGHRPGRVTTVLKNVISTGLVTDLPSVYTRRLERTLQGLFPDYPRFRITGSLAAALDLASGYLEQRVVEEDILDPLSRGPDKTGKVALWRPFVEEPLTASVLLPVIPFAVAGAPVPVGFAAPASPQLPPSEILSPLVLAGALRALHDLKRYSPPEWLRGNLLEDAPGWRQRGLYVLPTFPQAVYQEVFTAFLQEGVLLNPVFPGPCILPSEASPGELKKMTKLFRRYPGE